MNALNSFKEGNLIIHCNNYNEINSCVMKLYSNGIVSRASKFFEEDYYDPYYWRNREYFDRPVNFYYDTNGSCFYLSGKEDPSATNFKELIFDD